ncbi:tyrosine recombinase XerC [Clostridium luticellarii]|jgi:site-specific recombinase XerD|uniref:Tyrosine recombinase XerD n=1 Tax=Clostridium luticellarii TaxID=1691940 RepID=A0A2T0BBL1_9CLOT|nr:tyrosine recombinase XerC [Clostridium luticellarii]MCI1944155.1 tyrosine recombinase XerC [Clostridium luticellarii]MCI1967657.1 tyrosine recombinase XerC [Clostridium luticellarii]MCI1994893.1 tyrosine recombinase XerC [Clostridium luticellarii]MCI2039966.1 tyrosine recombinase XerC [Clostridium luticellarii]PRR81274.1 Tyrosine recombinase XerD [Clostridium luticellarii]
MQYDFKNIYDTRLPRCLNDFLNYLGTIKGKSKNTLSGYKVDLTMFFRFLKLYKGVVKDKKYEFKKIDIRDIDENFIRQINLSDLFAFISFAENYRNNGSYTRARKVASLKSFFKYLNNKAKIITENPALELESPKISKRNPIYLSLSESRVLLKAVDGKFKERDYCIITFFLNCGMRLSELCGINISNIKDDTLTVIGKGNKERTIYLNKACIKALKNYLNERNSHYNKIKDKDALFISRNYTRINKRTVELMLKKYLKNAGLDSSKYTPHKLRHTAATLMYKYGNVDIRSLQKILGHENVSTTQIYTHVDDEKLREAVKSNPLSEEEEK